MDLKEKINFIQDQSDEAIDAHFGISAREEVVGSGPEDLYLSQIDPRALYSSYKDLVEVMLSLYQKGIRSWCDIGCGIGRSCFLWTWLFDDTQAFGIEIVRERLNQVRVASLHRRITWLEADFSGPEFKLPQCDSYYMYLATGVRLDRLLSKIKKLRGSPLFVVVESHGDLKKRLSWESWWFTPTEARFKVFSHRHDPWISIYQKASDSLFFQLEEKLDMLTGIMPQDLKKHPSPLSYCLSKSGQINWELVIQEDDQKWTMDTLGLEWFDAQTLQGKNPKRQVNIDQAEIGLRIIPEGDYKTFSQLRREDRNLMIDSLSKRYENVSIRKIFIQPEFILELSDGSRVKRSEIEKWSLL